MSGLNRREEILGASQVRGQAGMTDTPEQLVRLTQEQYQLLEDKFPPQRTDNPIIAAQELGQQQVLQALRRGFVVTK